MQHQLTSEQLAFKAEVAAFLSANLPWEIAA